MLIQGLQTEVTFRRTLKLLIWLPLFPGSSAVEQATVNRLAGGSNPSRGAIYSNKITICEAQQMLLDTPICDFGWQATSFDLATPEGLRHSLASLMGENGLLIAFICNHCPYVKAVIDRLVADSQQLQEAGITTVAISANDYQAYPEDSPPRMAEFARQHNFAFPYLIDETQAVARAYGAVCTPDFFGLNKQGQLQYRGRLDDAKMGAASGRRAELLEAMLQIAKTGTGPAEQIPSMCC